MRHCQVEPYRVVVAATWHCYVRRMAHKTVTLRHPELPDQLITVDESRWLVGGGLRDSGWVLHQSVEIDTEPDRPASTSDTGREATDEQED